jgi:CheY-like chemotaxis protein
MHTLLVVDDEPVVRTLVARLARAAGYTVRMAGCAGEALDRMAESASSVVLCDIRMPDRSGQWLALQLRDQFPDTALVMMSGASQNELESSLEFGGMTSVAKPFSKEQLIGALQRACEWRDERADLTGPFCPRAN